MFIYSTVITWQNHAEYCLTLCWWGHRLRGLKSGNILLNLLFNTKHSLLAIVKNWFSCWVLCLQVSLPKCWNSSEMQLPFFFAVLLNYMQLTSETTYRRSFSVNVLAATNDNFTVLNKWHQQDSLLITCESWCLYAVSFPQWSNFLQTMFFADRRKAAKVRTHKNFVTQCSLFQKKNGFEKVLFFSPTHKVYRYIVGYLLNMRNNATYLT